MNDQRLLARDLDVLRLLASLRMMTRPQLRRALFGGRSETVAKRSVDRLLARGFIGAERITKVGYQVLWCTTKGRTFLLDEGVPATEIFAARGPAAAKDFQHTVRVVDVAIALMERGRAGDRTLFAWTLQRLFPSALAAIPDLLCLTRRTNTRPPHVLAVEVDLGHESFPVLTAKTATLARWLTSFSDARVALLILTAGSRRRVSLAAALASVPLAVPVAVGDLAAFTAASVAYVRPECADDRTPAHAGSDADAACCAPGSRTNISPSEGPQRPRSDPFMAME